MCSLYLDAIARARRTTAARAHDVNRPPARWRRRSTSPATHGPVGRSFERPRAVPVAPGGTRHRRAVLDRQTSSTSRISRLSRTSSPKRSASDAGSAATAVSLTVPMLRESVAIGVIARRRDEVVGPSPTSRSRCSRPSPTRPSSPSRTCGCSRSCRSGTETLDRGPRTADGDERDPAVISASPTDVQPVFDAIVRERGPTLRGYASARLPIRRRADALRRRRYSSVSSAERDERVARTRARRSRNSVTAPSDARRERSYMSLTSE